MVAKTKDGVQKKIKYVVESYDILEWKRPVVRNACTSQICCCFCAAPCHCFCSCLPPIKESTSTRLMYLLMLAFTIAMSVLSLIPEIPSYIISEFALFNSTCIKNSKDNCSEVFGNFTIVYKLCAGQLVLHIILIPVTTCGQNSINLSGAIHNGYWLWKWLFVITIDVLLILFVHQDNFVPIATVLRTMGLVGGFLYILVNIFFMCQVTTDFNVKLLLKSSVNSKWYIVIWLVTLILLAVTGFMGYIIFRFYSGCLGNVVISVAHTMLCCLVLFITAGAAIMRGNPNADLIQSSIVSSYIMYGTWSALHSRPNEAFNTAIFGKKSQYSASSLSTPLPTFANGTINDPSLQCATFGMGIYQSAAAWGQTFQYAGLIYYLLVALYKSVQTNPIASRSKTKQQTKSSPILDKHVTAAETTKSNEKTKEKPDNPSRDSLDLSLMDTFWRSFKPNLVSSGQKVIYNEVQQTLYNYWFLHFQFACSILFVMMELTLWFEIGSVVEWKPSWANFWIDLLTVWAIFVTYFVTLLMPPMTYAAHKYYNKLAKKGNKVPAANKKEEEQQIEEGGVKKESSSTAENDPETGAAIILPTIKDFLCCN